MLSLRTFILLALPLVMAAAAIAREDSLEVDYQNAKGLSNNFRAYREALLPIAARGHANGQLDLANSYYYGEPNAVQDSDLKKATELLEAKKWFERAADQGNGEAMWHLAHMHRHGISTDRDDKLAFEYMSRAAQAGYKQSFFDLAEMYEKGEGTSVDSKEAVRWYLRSANAPGYSCSMADYKVGEAFERGKGVTVNLEQAVHWYRKAADNHSWEGKRALGLMYLKGKGGLAADKEKAKELFGQSAESGDPEGVYQLAVICKQNKDYARASMLLAQPLVGSPLPEAILEQAELYEKGLGVARDLNYAASLYAQAQSLGIAEAATGLRRVEEQMLK